MRGGNVGQTVASGSGQGGGTAASGNHVVRGIEAPIKQIAENAGLSGDVVIDKVRSLPSASASNVSIIRWRSTS